MVRSLKTQLRLLPETSEGAQSVRVDLEFWQEQDDDARYLSEVIKAKQSNLTRTNSDIRLLWSVVEAQIKLGEIQPGRLSGNYTESLDSNQERPVESANISKQETNVSVPQDTPVQSKPVDSPITSDVLGIEAFLSDETPKGT